MSVMTARARVAGATFSCLLCGHQTEWDPTMNERERCGRCGGNLVVEELRPEHPARVRTPSEDLAALEEEEAEEEEEEEEVGER